jgi:hypothetical protein
LAAQEKTEHLGREALRSEPYGSDLGAFPLLGLGHPTLLWFPSSPERGRGGKGEKPDQETQV